MTLQAAANTTLSIGTTAVATNQTQYEADTYTAVGQLESIGEFGDANNPISFTGLSDARVQKFKGSADAGNMSFSYGLDDSDSGQAALIAAHADATGVYNFKVEFNAGEVRFFSGQVLGLRESAVNADAIVVVSGEIGINTTVLKVAAP